MEHRRQILEPWFKTSLAVLAVVAAGLLAWRGREVFLLAFAGLLVAVFLRAPTDWLCRRTGWRDGVCFGVTLIALVALWVGLLWFAGPRLAEQADQLSQELPRALEGPMNRLEGTAWGGWLVERVDGMGGSSSPLRGMVQRATGVASSTFGALAEIVIVFFAGLFLGAAPPLYRRGALLLLRPDQRHAAAEHLEAVGDTLRSWLLARCLSMTLIFVATFGALTVLDIPLAFILAVLAGFLTFIPNVGPLLAAAPAVLLGLLDSPTKALWVALAYLAIQTVESYLITPLIEFQTVSLPPALVLLTQVFLGILFGLWGLVLASPLVAVAMVLTQRLWVRDPETMPATATG